VADTEKKLTHTGGSLEVIEVNINEMLTLGLLETLYRLRSGTNTVTEHDYQVIAELYITHALTSALISNGFRVTTDVEFTPPQHKELAAMITSISGIATTLLRKHSIYTITSIIDKDILFIYLSSIIVN